ncbi:hypothetical protein PHAVU_011G096500 [Phaseolus vulgaris]
MPPFSFFSLQPLMQPSPTLQHTNFKFPFQFLGLQKIGLMGVPCNFPHSSTHNGQMSKRKHTVCSLSETMDDGNRQIVCIYFTPFDLFCQKTPSTVSWSPHQKKKKHYPVTC